MKRFHLMLLVAIFAAFLMVGTASAASTIDIALSNTVDADDNDPVTGFQGQGPVEVAQELLSSSEISIDLNDDNVAVPGLWTKRYIVYRPQIDLGAGSTITVTLTNGAIKATTGTIYYICNLSALSAGITGPVGKMVDVITETTTGYTQVSMKFDTETVDPNLTGDLPLSGDNLVFSQSLTDADGDGVLCNSAVDIDSPILLVTDKLNTAGDMTIAITAATDSTGASLNAPKAASEVLVTAVNGLNCVVYDDGGNDGEYTTDTIDVEADNGSRTAFEGGQVTSEAGVYVEVGGELTFDLDSTDDDYTLSVTGDSANTEIKSLTFEGSAMAKSTTVANTWSYSTDDFTNDIEAGIDLIFTVNNTEGAVLNTATYTTTVSFTDFGLDTAGNAIPTAAGSTSSPKVVCNAETTHLWNINGAQFIVPYLHNDWTNYGAMLFINNASNADAAVSIDVIANSTGDSDLNVNGIGTYSDGTDILIDAGEHLFISKTQLQGIIETAIPDLASSVSGTVRFAIRVTITAPATNVHVMALQADPAGPKRTLPTLTNDDSASWNW